MLKGNFMKEMALLWIAILWGAEQMQLKGDANPIYTIQSGVWIIKKMPQTKFVWFQKHKQVNNSPQ